jgi:mannose/cellobiose epimerase-like protein (N-acyl-D-glucosamine 2-epimerase family)
MGARDEMRKTEADAAQARYIARNDLVVQVAKLIDPEAFWPQWQNLDTGKPLDATRTRYNQATALSKASEILKLAASQKNLRNALIDSELEFWKMLGIEGESLAGAVRQKYPSPV